MSDTAFEVIKAVLAYANLFFVLYLIGYSTFLLLAVVVGSSELYARKQKERLKNTLLQNYYVPVSIIVPAYNEEVTVVETVRSLLSLDYTLYEIIVVDDGSKDQTSGKLIEAFDMKLIRRPIHKKLKCQPEEFVYESLTAKVPITLIRKKNGGKADSLNMGINACRYPYFISMDADSALQYDSLGKIVRPVMEQENIIAVGGVVRPANDMELRRGRVMRYRLPKNILVCLQMLEYDRSFLASRIFFDKFNGSLIISGAFGLFRKDIVIAAGGYDSNTLGEDMELVVKLHAYCVMNNVPYLVKYATDAICWSQAPERLRDLCRQRRRWHIGLFQSMWKHKIMLSNPRFGAVSLISCFYFLIYELLSPFIEIFGLVTIVLAFIFDLINIPFMLMFFGIYTVFGCVLTITAFLARVQTIDLKVSFQGLMKAILLCVLEITVLRLILTFVRATAFIGYKKRRLRWGKIERRKIDLK